MKKQEKDLLASIVFGLNNLSGTAKYSPPRSRIETDSSNGSGGSE